MSTAIKILDMQVFRRTITAKSIGQTGISMHNLVFNVMDLSFSKSSRCLLYNFVDRNHILNLSDPFVNANDATKRNGVVGNTGNTTPTAPMPTHKSPNPIQNIFFVLFIFVLFAFIYLHLSTQVSIFLTVFLIYHFTEFVKKKKFSAIFAEEDLSTL